MQSPGGLCSCTCLCCLMRLTSRCCRQAVDAVDKEDLELANHLAGHRRKYLRLKFNSVGDLMEVHR